MCVVRGGRGALAPSPPPPPPAPPKKNRKLFFTILICLYPPPPPPDNFLHTHHNTIQTEKARHILQVRQKLLDSHAPQRGVAMWPSDEELSKLSDEHKAMLAQKCVHLLMRKSVVEEAAAEVRVHER